MREGSYQTTVNGKKMSVSYTDADTLRDVADLYAVLEGEFQGTPSASSEALKNMLAELQAGKPLDDMELTILRRLKGRYLDQLETFRASAANDEQGWVPLPEGDGGRVAEAMAVLPKSLREAYGTQSATPKDQAITAPHLHDGLMHDAAHARQHAERLNDPDVRADPSSLDFNVEHVLNHLESLQDHGSRLGKHLEKFASDPAIWTDEKQTLHKMREDAPVPPPNLREATSDTERCGVCRMDWCGRCWGYDGIEVRNRWVCDAFTPGRLGGGIQDLALSESGLAAAISTHTLTDLARMREDTKATVALDFDGVIYDRTYEPGANNLAGKLIPGTKAGLTELARRFRLVVFTARPNPKAVRDWLDREGLGQLIADVTNVKPSAAAYVDNRSLKFSSWPQTIRDLERGETSPYESNIPGGKT